MRDLMGVIRRQFCPDMPDKIWYKAHYHWLRKRAVMWPASFMVGKGFTIPGARYKQILLDVLQEVKRYGNTRQVRAWQPYLITCIQSHFRHHWEDYYAEAKSVRASVENALMGIGRATPASPAIDAVEAIAAAQRVASPGRKTRGKAAPARQIKLL